MSFCLCLLFVSFVSFQSSNSKDEYTSLLEYVERMQEKQEHIYYIAGASLEEVRQSPFVERLLKKDYEIIYLTEPIDEYSIQSLPEFEGKKFQNVAKDGLELAGQSSKAKAAQEALATKFEPLTKWLSKKPLKDVIEKAVISQRLSESPCAVVANQWGW